MKIQRVLAIVTLLCLTVASSLYAQDSKTSKQVQGADSTDATPDPDQFVPVEKEPQFDMQDLIARVRYPEELRKNGIEGRVTVMVLVDRNGRVRKTRIVENDDPLFEEAAVDAVRGLVFSPALQEGKPVEVWVAIPIIFQLR